MTDKEILKKAYIKVIAKISPQYGQSFWEQIAEAVAKTYILSPYNLIFQHSFAEAFWGEEPYWAEEWHQLDKDGLENYNEGVMNCQSN